MRVSSSCLLALIALLAIASSTHVSLSASAASTVPCPVTVFNKTMDYFPDKIANDAVSTPGHFTIRYFLSYKVLTQALPTANITYVLYMCGTPIPSPTVSVTNDTAVALTPTVDATTARFFAVPLVNVMVQETVASSYMELLGVRQSITWMTTTYASSACLAQMTRNGTLLPYNASAVAVADGLFVGNAYNANAKSINIASTSGTLHLRMRLEYLNFVSLFFNREKVANVLFADMDARYSAYSALATAAASSSGWSPVVAWVTSGYKVSVAPYKLLLVQAVGARAFVPPGTPDQYYTITFANASDYAAALANVDILMDETYLTTNTNDYAVVLAKLGLTNYTSAIPALANGRVWRFDGRSSPNGYDWYEQGVVQIDSLLADMMRVVNPTIPTFLNSPSQSGLVMSDTTQWLQALCQAPNRLWFRDAAIGETFRYVSEVCPNVSLPLDTLSSRTYPASTADCSVPVIGAAPARFASSMSPFSLLVMLVFAAMVATVSL